MTTPTSRTRSTVPAVLTYLTGMAASVLPRVQVVDGPPRNNMKSEHVLIGYDDGQSAVVLGESTGSPANRQGREEYDVVSRAVVRVTGVKVPEARLAAFAIADAIAGAVEADLRLGGACTAAFFTGAEYLPQLTDLTQTWATVRFLIHVQAFKS